jgi:catechol 2,3-dioxygenase-like lactoylglutathione lyase family enzyme
MDITIHASFLPHEDPDASLGFYRDVLGFEVRSDVGRGTMRWITRIAEDAAGELTIGQVLSPGEPPGAWPGRDRPRLPGRCRRGAQGPLRPVP